jgi:hypothetical protein
MSIAATKAATAAARTFGCASHKQTARASATSTAESGGVRSVDSCVFAAHQLLRCSVDPTVPGSNLNLLVTGLEVSLKPRHAKIRRDGYRRNRTSTTERDRGPRTSAGANGAAIQRRCR